MITSLYQLVNKGSFRALSSLLALALIFAIFTHTYLFALNTDGMAPHLTLIVFWSVVALCIHGIGFEIRAKIWQLIFMPVFAYVVAGIALLHIYTS